MATVKKGSKAAKAKMAKVRAARSKKGPKKTAIKTAYKEERQIPVKWTNSGGYLYRYNKEADKKRKNALPPGKRISKDGDVYYEYRVNRSDKTGSLTGNTICGINKEHALNKLYNDYGRCQANLLQTSSLKSKKMFRKHLKDIKAEITKIKKLK